MITHNVGGDLNQAYVMTTCVVSGLFFFYSPKRGQWQEKGSSKQKSLRGKVFVDGDKSVFKLPRLLSMEPIAEDVLLRTLETELKRCRWMQTHMEVISMTAPLLISLNFNRFTWFTETRCLSACLFKAPPSWIGLLWLVSSHMPDPTTEQLRKISYFMPNWPRGVN